MSHPQQYLTYIVSSTASLLRCRQVPTWQASYAEGNNARSRHKSFSRIHLEIHLRSSRMFNKMTTVRTLFRKAKPVTTMNMSAAKEKAPACGCLPTFGYSKFCKALSRRIKTVLISQDKLEQQVEDMTQQTDGVILEVQVLPSGEVKCSLTVVHPQLDNQPAFDDEATARCSSTNPSAPLEDQPLTEPLQAANRDELCNVDMDVRCDIILTDTVSLRDKAKGVRTYSSKLADWCKKALDSSRVVGVTSRDVTWKTVSSKWGGSSKNSRGWGSGFVSFRKSCSSSSP